MNSELIRREAKSMMSEISNGLDQIKDLLLAITNKFPEVREDQKTDR